jgi:hypothetical protein
MRWWVVSFGFLPNFTPRATDAGASFSGAGADQLALEFRKAAQDGEHKAARAASLCPSMRRQANESPRLLSAERFS